MKFQTRCLFQCSFLIGYIMKERGGDVAFVKIWIFSPHAAVLFRPTASPAKNRRNLGVGVKQPSKEAANWACVRLALDLGHILLFFCHVHGVNDNKSQSWCFPPAKIFAFKMSCKRLCYEDPEQLLSSKCCFLVMEWKMGVKTWIRTKALCWESGNYSSPARGELGDPHVTCTNM